MTLDEAILHCAEIISSGNECKDCVNEHIQLIGWLAELKLRRENKWEDSNAKDSLHFDY